PAGRSIHVRRGADLRAAPRRAGGGSGAGHLHHRPTDSRPRRQGVHRLRTERPRPDDRGALLPAPTAGRARLLPAPVERASVPPLWSEVTARLDPSRYTMVPVPKRFEKMADPLTSVLTGAIDMAAAIGRIEPRFAGASRGGENGRKDVGGARKQARRRPPRA